MARTAPEVNGTPTYQRVSFHVIDSTGDQKSDSYIIPAGATVGQIEAAAEAVGDAINTSLWKVEMTAVYEGNGSKSNAVPNVANNSSYDVINILYRNPTTRLTQDGVLRGPIATMFLEGTDTPDVSVGSPLTGVVSAIEGMLGAAAWQAISARFTEQREINSREKF